MSMDTQSPRCSLIRRLGSPTILLGAGLLLLCGCVTGESASGRAEQTSHDDRALERLALPSDNPSTVDERTQAQQAYLQIMEEFQVIPASAAPRSSEEEAEHPWSPRFEPRANRSVVLGRENERGAGPSGEPGAAEDDSPPAPSEPTAVQVEAAAISWLKEQLQDPAFRRAFLRLAEDAAKSVDARPGSEYRPLPPDLGREQAEVLRLLQSTLQRADWEAVARQLRPTVVAAAPEPARAEPATPEQLDAPVTIGKAVLARRVSGFGIYDALPSTRMAAGRVNSAVAYVELERFRSDRKGDLHVVNLLKQVELYSDTAGHEPIWRTPPARLVDESRNQRRDFFTVQVIRLPPLAVGHYVLKINITDQNSQTTDVASIPITIVAHEQ